MTSKLVVVDLHGLLFLQQNNKQSMYGLDQRYSPSTVPMSFWTQALWLGAVIGCGESDNDSATPNVEDTAHLDTADDGNEVQNAETDCEPVTYTPYPFVAEVVDVQYGEGAGFGQESFPDIVLGPPQGFGEYRGSLDVLTLGEGGSITLAFEQSIVDVEGPDFIVFENVFVGWLETGIVSASEDGETWFTWACDPVDADNNFPGCAGVNPTLSHPDNCIDARDPLLAGGDAFDLSDIGLSEVQYIRIEDSGANTLGGFDLDAVAIIHGQPN